jgi:hypothetical protein
VIITNNAGSSSSIWVINKKSWCIVNSITLVCKILKSTILVKDEQDLQNWDIESILYMPDIHIEFVNLIKETQLLTCNSMDEK